MSIRKLYLLLCFLFFSGLAGKAQKKLPASFATLTQGQLLHGFKTTAIYLNDAGNPMGGRFIHQATGFTLDLLQIESVPQTFIWVNTFPVSDKGEPHTQEHLLITKGNKGHELNTREGMSLAQSNAFTSQVHTVYNFNTGAGAEVFYTLFQKYLDALLYPDYTNEEVSREVRNWGVTQNPDKSLRLEEKGSVYNEMSSTMNNSYSLLYDSLGRLLYGNNHPLSYNAGGLPAGIRTLNAADILKYHNDNYYLGNMGAINSLPSSMPLDAVLQRTNILLLELNAEAKNIERKPAVMPPYQPAPAGEISVINFPSENAQETGTILLAYPPSLKLNPTEDLLAANFLSVFAGDASTNLYKIFIDSKTKQAGIDAQAVYGYIDNKNGEPVYMGLDGVSAINLTKEKAAFARQLIIAELKTIAAWKDHSPELLEFNKRFKNSLSSYSRYESKFVNSPPEFGFRNTGDAWYDQLQELGKMDGFKKSVVLKPQFEEVKKMLSTGTNIWKTYLQKWNLITTEPFVIVTKANPSLIEKAAAEKKERANAEVARLKNLYDLSEDQQAILRYKAVYDSNTAVLEKLEQAHTVKFIDNPPLSLDEQLIYKQTKLPGDIPVVASVFNNMTTATTGIAIKLNSIPQNKLVYLAMLPDLLTQTGIIKNGKPVSYQDMSQQIQQQILSLQSYYSTSEPTGRVELVLKAAGNNAAEAQRGIEWMNDVLKQPNWRKDNLPRMLDLVEQDLSQLRKTMHGAEESWVNDPGKAWRMQDNRLMLSTTSFLTRTHNIFRLKWMLKHSATPADSTAISNFLSSLSQAETNRNDLKKLLAQCNTTVTADLSGANKKYADEFTRLPANAKQLAIDAARDLEQLLNDIPDESLNTDWKYLCNIIQKDLAQTPEKTLADLNSLRTSILKNYATRIFIIGSESTEQKLNAPLQKLVSGFSKAALVAEKYDNSAVISQRVKQRTNSGESPLFVGLINPDSQTGVFINSTPLITYKDTEKEKILQFLAAELYGGAGKQSVYTKTTGAGLSYSTGVGANPGSGRFFYYAERTPELPQTLRFVIDEIKKSAVDSNMVDYVISLAVGGFRSAADYGSRGEAMAADLADGTLPELIKKFRLAVLKLRQEAGLLGEIYQHKTEVYEKILPGYGIAAKDVPGATYFVIGPEKQMVAYEAYLKSVEGNETKLYRLYPRDFWITD